MPQQNMHWWFLVLSLVLGVTAGFSILPFWLWIGLLGGLSFYLTVWLDQQYPDHRRAIGIFVAVIFLFGAGYRYYRESIEPIRRESHLSIAVEDRRLVESYREALKIDPHIEKAVQAQILTAYFDAARQGVTMRMEQDLRTGTDPETVVARTDGANKRIDRIQSKVLDILEKEERLEEKFRSASWSIGMFGFLVLAMLIAASFLPDQQRMPLTLRPEARGNLAFLGILALLFWGAAEVGLIEVIINAVTALWNSLSGVLPGVPAPRPPTTPIVPVSSGFNGMPFLVALGIVVIAAMFLRGFWGTVTVLGLIVLLLYLNPDILYVASGFVYTLIAKIYWFWAGLKSEIQLVFVGMGLFVFLVLFSYFLEARKVKASGFVSLLVTFVLFAWIMAANERLLRELLRMLN